MLTALAALPGRAAAVSPTPALEAQHLVFLIEYIGTDYDNAVQNGTVVNPVEYGESVRFIAQVIQAYGARRERDAAVMAALIELQELIRQRAPGEQVWSASRALLPLLSRSLGDALQPVAVPNLANGRRLWLSDCAPCHGVAGDGHGPLAADMAPPPSAFRGNRLARLSPRHVFNAVILGIDGTPMPSFRAAYTDQQSWNVAFFLMTLGAEANPQRPPDHPALSLDELATQSNVQLLTRLRERRPDASPAEVDWVRANPVAATAGPGAAEGLGVALQIENAFGRVAERLFPRVVGVTGYVRDPAWSIEALRPQRGAAWIAANANALRYPGFRSLTPGSGVLLDDGYILSCAHLVRDEHGAAVPLVDVELADQRHVATAIVGTEPTLDLAILRLGVVPADDDTRAAIEFGDSDRLQVGQWLIALGDPPGAEKVFAVGVVAAPPARQCYQEERSATLLQSSLALPSGGQGGAVVDIFGRLVGLSIGPADATSAVAAHDQPTVARTLPINLVLNLFEALKVAHSERSPWLGISVLELPALRRRLGTAAQEKKFPLTGVYIDDVFDPSPASRAGVRPGDFLVALGGHRVLSVADFQMWLYVLGIGTRAELGVWRDGQPLQVIAPIESRPESATMR